MNKTKKIKHSLNNFGLYQFSDENLLKVLKNQHHPYGKILKQKTHYIYLKEYLGNGDYETQKGLSAGTILVEKNYISRSYLEDYQEHYILAYGEYNRYCERIHFFEYQIEEHFLKNDNTKVEFLKKIYQSNDFSDTFWNGYLGYFVKRPIPKGIIGVTLLKPYPTNCDDNFVRNYTVSKKYTINIFGKEVALNTLIYVEQDTIVGACATSALYVAFHKLSDLFNTPKPNQKKVSDAAGISVSSPNRKLKNKEGLTAFQMCKVIEKFGLAPELQDFTKNKFDSKSIKAYLYAYLRMGLPIILGISIKDAGDHAITLTGYKDFKENKIPIETYRSECFVNNITNFNKIKYPLILKGGFINRFYAHDDQIGPFARLGFDDKNEQLLSSWWYEDKGISFKKPAEVFISIIPLSNRIRIPFEKVYRHVGRMHLWFHENIIDLDGVLWDIYLNHSNDEKQDLLNSNAYDFDLHSELLTKSLPKYVWVVDFYISGYKCFKILYDASEIDEDFFAKEIVYFSDEIKDFFLNYFNETTNPDLIYDDQDYADELNEKIGFKTINFFRNSLQLAEIDLQQFN